MVTENTTPNRGYQEPAVGNTLKVDIDRLVSALRAIDVDVASALAAIAAKAGLASPAFTGTPTAPTAAPGTDSGQLATTAFVRAAVAALVDSAPGALDTLNELAAAIGDDPNFAATMAALIGTKADAAATTAALAGKADAAATAAALDSRVRADAAQLLAASQQAQARSNISAALKGHIFGLTLSNNASDAANDIDIAVGEAASTETNPVLMVLASALTKRTDAAWAVGNNQGGWLDGASMPNGTGHVFLIGRSDTGVVDVGISASLTPTLPTNYTWKRRIGSILRESGAIAGFVQDGDDFFYKIPSTEVSATNPGTSAVTRTLRIPLGLQLFALCNVVVRNSISAGQWMAYISDLATDDLTVALTGALSNAGTGNIDNRQGQQVRVRTNTSGQIRSRLAASDANTTLYMATVGWTDKRGRS
ncbi:hypothetical protein [Shinella fusca]|uniref:Phage tail protein n=1 Tax=Shinella fusca TaxID=544480 RepID=A0A7W7YQV7_9HYPH|nr:hypothetical protein [Shinella fusca]MBB5040691.1 hypothetical protein [Shinella fusca]